MPVAMTRPKRHLCIIGDSDTVGRYAEPRNCDLKEAEANIFRGSQFLKKWMGFLEENASLRFPTLDDLSTDN